MNKFEITADFTRYKEIFLAENAKLNLISKNDEKFLYEILSMLNSHNYHFIMSNVKEHKGRTNVQLIEWAHANNFRIVEMGLSGWRYAKNEIIVTNIE